MVTHGGILVDLNNFVKFRREYLSIFNPQMAFETQCKSCYRTVRDSTKK